MFEKEAKEYRKENLCKKCHKHCKEGMCTCSACKIKTFRDGATFGYNKANEWRFVKDGDLPKVGQKCYFIHSNLYGEDNKVIFSESSIKVLTGVYTFILDEETGDETTETCFYDNINDEEIYEQEVYAWKEITLPELPKEIRAEKIIKERVPV